MATRLDLAQTVTQYLTHDKVESLFHQMGSGTDGIMIDEYQANVQVITWAILERLKASNSFPGRQLTEDNVKPIVDRQIRDMCKIVRPDRGLPEAMAPSGFLSRMTWWSLKLFGRELEF